MNKTYSKVWSHALNQLVVVSEIATHRRGRKGTRAIASGPARSVLYIAVAFASLSFAAIPQLASAQTYSAGGGVANGNQSVAIGTNSAATSTTGNPLAIGGGAKAVVTGEGSPIALGTNANASGAPDGNGSFEAIAIGNSANATGQWGSAIGLLATATGRWASALGSFASASAAQSTAVGVLSQATGVAATAIGAGGVDASTAVRASGVGAIALGGNGIAGANAAANNAIAIGGQSAATNVGAMALGASTSASAVDSVAIGPRAIASGTTGAIAVGADAKATNENAAAFGVGANASGSNSTAVGVNAGSAGFTATAVGANSRADSDFSIALGTNTHAAAIASIAAGINAQALAASTLAVGDTTTVAATAGTGSVAVGHNSQVQGGTGAVAIGEGQTANGNGAVAIGDPNTVNGTGAVGMGANNTANGDGAVALGNGNNAQGQGSVALGNTSSALAAGAVAFGDAAAANNANDVALGSGSTTLAAVGTPNTTINGTTYIFAGQTPGSTVSVGTPGAERTITNLAAGRISGTSTDAINGSQLFATNQAVGTVGTTVTNLGNTIANSIGGNTTYDPTTGNVTTNVTYGGNTFNSVQDVFNQIDGAVNGGGIKYFHANSALADSIASGTDSVAIGPVSNAATTNAVSIGNGATAGANIGDVALGSGSTTGAVVATTGGTIAGNTYTYAGTAPTSAVSVGAAGTERTITNVAAGRVSGTSTDAINGSQLFATNQALETLNSTVVAGATHYFSVNDGGTPGGNFANDGATGLNALAAGVGATATADNATALGQGTGVSVQGGVGLGAGAVSDRAIAPATGTITAGTHLIPFNTTDRNLRGAVSVGNATDFRQITNLADGTEDQDAVSLRQLKGALSSFAVSPTKYFHANSAAADSLAGGAESVAIGPQTTVNGDNGIGMGNHAIVAQTAPGGTAIGQNTTVNLADGVALGTNATSNGIQAMALGAGSQAAFAGSVALGAGSATDAPVATTGVTLYGTNYTFAGAAPGSTVSVGSVGAERTVTNLAAGRISATSTDAINGSQLYATNQTLELLGSQVINLANTVNNFPPGGGGGGNNGTYNNSGDNNAPSSASGNNSTAAGAGSSASGNNSTAVGAGSSASGDNSVAIGAGSVANGANTVSVGSAGQTRTITNVSNGVAPTDAANVGQVNQALEEAKNWSKDYTDQRLQSVNRDLDRVGNRANAGIASAMAMAGLGQAYQPNQSSAGVALGSFHGETGIAVGVSTITESGRYILKLNGTTNSRGDAGASVGATVVW